MSILYKKIRVGELGTNCYLCWNERTKECLIIDAGDDGVGISEEIERLGLKPIMVLATHGHFDHTLAVLDLKLIYEIPFACSSKDEFLIKRQDETARYFLKRKINIPKIEIDIDLDKEKVIKLGKEVLEVIKSPGHSPGGICLYSKNNDLLFSGDTLFKGARGRTDFSYGNEKDIFKSIAKIMKLPKKTIILSGHGEETSVTEEKRVGFMLRG